MKRSLTIALTLLLALCRLPARAASAFDPAGLAGLQGYSREEDGGWRYERTLAWSSGDERLGLGFVLEGEEGQAPGAPWLWVEYLIQDEARPVSAVALSCQGSERRYEALDLSDDGSYATWSLGLLGEALLSDLSRGGSLLVTVETEDGVRDFRMAPEDTAPAAEWARALLDQAVMAAVDSMELAGHDATYLPRRQQPVEPGSFDHSAFAEEPGYRIDRIDRSWRLERQVVRAEGALSLGLGFVVEGQLSGPIHPPWIWAELDKGGSKLRIDGIKLLADDTLYAFGKLVVSEGYSSWTLGQRSGQLLSQLPGLKELLVKLYVGDYTYDFALDEAALQPLRDWGQALRRTGLRAYLDGELLREFDYKYEVDVR